MRRGIISPDIRELRPYPYYRPSTYKAAGVDVATAPGLKIGFLPGTGDDVPKALDNLGLKARFSPPAT